MKEPHIESRRLLYETRDYERFAFMAVNRRVNRGKVDAIKRSITRHGNLLYMFPVVVQEKKNRAKTLEIHEGQHRFTAVRELRETVTYTKDVDYVLTVQTIRAINAVQTPWRLLDYLDSYCAHQSDQYLRIREIMTQHDVSLSCLLQLITGIDKKHWTIQFKEGQLRLLEEAFAIQVLDLAKTCASTIAFAYSGHFVGALAMLIRNPNFEIAVLLRKLDIPYALNILERQGGVEEMFVALVKLYNYKTQGQNLQDFRMIDSAGRIQRHGRWIGQEDPDSVVKVQQ